jgi:ketosteroid isomerase-like protein
MQIFITPALLLAALAPLSVSPAVAHAESSPRPPSIARSRALDLSSPQRTMDSFFAALNSFDADSYSAMLTDDATLFFTGPPFPIRRVQGRAEIMKLVTPLFDNLRAKGTRGTVAPEDLEFQTWSDTSVVTFHIPVGPALDRRTFVLRRQHGKWKIEHLHASVTREGTAPLPKSG